jgi:hypothetical protein
MIRYKSSRQLSISEFEMPFESKPDEYNRWVVLSKIVPWEECARLYYKNFKSNRGATTKGARLVPGVIIIKHIMKTDDRGVIEMIRENRRFFKDRGIRHMRDIPLPYFVSLLLKLMKVRNINIYPLGAQMKLCV